jgi:uncharacterized membrane protein
MNKKEFLGSLEKHLKYLPKEDREDALNYYSEYIDDYNFAENEDISAKLGNPKDIAKNIIKECAEKHIDSHNKNKTAKSGAGVVWMTILLIASAPVTVPLAFALLVVFLSLLFTIIVTLLALAVSFGAVIVAGILIFVAGMFVPGIGQKFVLWGTGLIIAAIGVLLLLLVVVITELLIKLLALISKSIIKKNKGEYDE